MKYKSVSIFFTLILTVLLLTNISFADGKFVSEVEVAYPDIPVQRAIIKYKDNTETLVVESTLDGKGKRFGWIIPVPNEPKRIEKVSPGLLQTLSLQLKPILVHNNDAAAYILTLLGIYLICLLLTLPKGLGVLRALTIISITFLFMVVAIPNFISYRNKGGYKQPLNGLEIISQNIIGSYETYTLKADNLSVLNQWLTENGYRPFAGQDLKVIDYYIKNKWYFFAAKLVRKNGKISTPHPVLIEFESKEPIYPMRLTASSAPSLYLELYMISDKELKPKIIV